jgi:hypothetical protein
MFNRENRLFIAVFLVSVILTACGTAPQNSTTSALVAEVGEGGSECV